MYACTHIVLQVAYAVTYGYVKPDEDWLYQESLFDETPETDPEGEKTPEKIRPLLEAASYPVGNEQSNPVRHAHSHRVNARCAV